MFTINRKVFLALFSLAISIPVCAKSIIDIQTWNTTRGAKVLFTEVHELPIFDISVVFYAGSIADGKNYGLANFTSSMLNAGTKNLTVDQIADSFHYLGALFYSYTGRDLSEVSLRCLAEPRILNPTLQTFGAVLNEPIFPEREINRMKEQILVAIEQKKQYPQSIAFTEFYKELYQNFPYSHPIIGTAKTVTAINRQLLQAFYRKYYTARNALIIMVGDITRNQAEEIAEKLTAKLPLGEKASIKEALLKKSKSLTKHLEFPSTQTNVLIGQLGVTRNDPDYFPLYIGNYILGRPLFSDLFLEVREKLGLVYAINSSFIFYLYPGLFLIQFSTSNAKVAKALQITTKTLNNFIEKGPTAKQLSIAKKSLTNSFPFRLASNLLIKDALQTIGFYNLSLDYFDTYIAKINAVTLKDIQAAFKQHLARDKMLIIKVGQSSKPL